MVYYLINQLYLNCTTIVSQGIPDEQSTNIFNNTEISKI